MKIGLKNIVLKYYLENNVILRFNSELIKIEDKYGDIKFLFSLLDGRFDENEACQEFLKVYPHYLNEFNEYMKSLKEMGVIDYIYKNPFDEYKSIRWSRNFDFYEALSTFNHNKYEYQNKIFNARICLLGCGGLGSHILYELTAVGFLNITIVDFDKIELSNLNRQILYKESDIGKSKVKTACENIKKFSPISNILPIECKIHSKDDILKIIKDHDLVICVADKPREKIIDWLNRACIEANTPYINGGLNLARCSFYSVIPNKTGCAECWKNSVLDTIQDDILNIDINDSVDYTKPAPALSALVAIAAGIMVSEAIKIVTNICPPSLSNKLKVFDFLSCEIKTMEHWKIDKECSVCGNKNG
ncbi:HesA/MoeB/ThiF family protein [Histophilus somni]|uniref:ThiF family adenylyltransferase n=2 Tax=Histophilus somni TaxID=731 RepID=A0AAX2S4Z9_HISSO|nr:ThiF family adenylyltransferase [Histophilus somni]TDF40998.1 ThiF family adenylyltransferase [Histophilus somni]TEW31562.1 ThiF family adenylyltransferase [Histophilus somni]TFF02862.1 ThiF family adenylyltransferase [Histophilus somni]THA97611.1 ThiF family adenylyltransferase [Histophilus somni]TJY53507.1 ThiF family adenylyltransferase [Histophilus somni]